MNRLGQELSPYLRQHAHNPVDWFPWGPEAIALAKAEDRPILLSIGYSACHWCHVMERESFDDPAIAAVMNDLYVSIKVDREERPDLDQIYQMVVQLMGRSGGWPLTVFLTPDLRPFFGGTYFPPVDRYGMPSFPTVLHSVAEAYRSKREQIEKSAQEITRAIGEVTAPKKKGEGDLPADALLRSASLLARRWDEAAGGFGDAPKFPNTMALDVMLRAWKRHGDAQSLARAQRGLDAMREGGIRDHLGGGFHRYSTDARWRVPHFEKMLYDNALLLRLSAELWRATREERYAETAREIVAWLMREMRSPAGGFYSTQDADSEGEEGKFFAWTPEQLLEVLGEDDAKIASLRWGVAPGGNFEHGTTVLHASREPAVIAKQLGKDEALVRAALARAKEKLFVVREGRPKPFRDEKVIASWNGLMIGALADAGGALGERAWVETAAEALRFVRGSMWDAEKKVLARLWKDGASKGEGFLEDHGDLAGAALDVWESGGGDDALVFAREIADVMLERFWDETDGGFFFAAAGGVDLIVRAKDAYDDATPSGTSSACHALLRLAAITGEERYATHAERVLRDMGPDAVTHPMGFGNLLGAVDRYLAGPTEVVVVAAEGDEEGQKMLALARRAYLPSRVLVRIDPNAAEGGGPVALLAGQRQIEGRATAYVCRGRTCSPPVTSVEELVKLLEGG